MFCTHATNPSLVHLHRSWREPLNTEVWLTSHSDRAAHILHASRHLRGKVYAVRVCHNEHGSKCQSLHSCSSGETRSYSPPPTGLLPDHRRGRLGFLPFATSFPGLRVAGVIHNPFRSWQAPRKGEAAGGWQMICGKQMRCSEMFV